MGFFLLFCDGVVAFLGEPERRYRACRRPGAGARCQEPSASAEGRCESAHLLATVASMRMGHCDDWVQGIVSRVPFRSHVCCGTVIATGPHCSMGEQCGCPVRKLNSGAPTEDRSGAAPIGPNAKCNDSPFCARSRVRPPKNAIENGVRGTVGDDLARAGTQ